MVHIFFTKDALGASSATDTNAAICGEREVGWLQSWNFRSRGLRIPGMMLFSCLVYNIIHFTSGDFQTRARNLSIPLWWW